MESLKLEGKNAIITGGTSGIGEASAKLFAGEGASVVLIGRSEDKGSRVQKEIQIAGGKAEFVKCDVSDHRQVVEAVENIINAVGKIDILFNNAGGERESTSRVRKLKDGTGW